MISKGQTDVLFVAERTKYRTGPSRRRDTLSEFFLTGKHLDKGQVDGGPKAWYLNINMYRVRYVTNRYGGG